MPWRSNTQRTNALMNCTRIGIFGGSFNPFHLGHLNIANLALSQFQLDKVVLIPCKVSPFKTECSPEMYVDDIHRLNMTELCIEGDEKFELSRIEIDRGGVSYSHDTVLEIKKLFPQSEFFFIIGADTLLTLSKWYKIHALLTMCEFVTVGRPGVEEDLTDVPGFDAVENRRLREHRITGKLFDISSSDIRKKIAAGESISGLVDPKVEDYIRKFNLYVN